MSSDTLIAGDVMDDAASLMNDTAKSVYTYAAQLPYLRMVTKKLRTTFERRGVAVTQTTTSPILQMTALTTGPTDITFVSTPALPVDFVEPKQLWERTRGIDPYTPMTRKDFLPHNLEGQPTSSYIYYQWDAQKITVPACNQNNDIKMDYVRELFQTITDQNTSLALINGRLYLALKTAEYLARWIERNATSADELRAEAEFELNDVLGISSKSKQTIQSRRKPFRAGFKRRGIIT